MKNCDPGNGPKWMEKNEKTNNQNYKKIITDRKVVYMHCVEE